jgi:YidC/Oxa1 family membrane protein insertase
VSFLAYPFANILLVLYNLLGESTVGAIAVFTLLINLAMLPLTLRQQRSARKMQEIQPELEKIKKKYANDREKQAQATMKLYQDRGVSLSAGCLPLLIQLPIWFSLIGAIRSCVPSTPLDVFQFSQNIYRFLPGVVGLVPLNSTFLGMDLGMKPSPAQWWSYTLPVLVYFTSWLQQKLITPQSAKGETGSTQDSMAAQQMKMMQTMMPLLMMFFTLQYAVGLSIYFVLSAVIRIAQHYIVQLRSERASGSA